MRRILFRWRPVILVTLLLLAPHAPMNVQAQTMHDKQVPPADRIAGSRDLLDVNVATDSQLKGLPGMGEAYAQRVIAGRPYRAKNQLVTRGILPTGEYERIRELIVAHRPKR